MGRFGSLKEKHKTETVLAGLLLISIILIIISTNTVVFKPKQVGLTIFSTIQKGFSGVGSFFSRTVNSIGELQDLRAEHQELQKRMTEYRSLERDILELKNENAELREQLDFSNKIGYEHVAAEIIGKDPGNIFSTITINKGLVHGLKKGMPVIAYQDGFQGLVGKIVDLGRGTSNVLPLIDRSCYVAARLQTTRYEGLVSGRGRGEETVVMQYVKKRARNETKYGDLVITSGMRSLYPKGIYIGRVREIEAKEYETSLQLTIETIIDFSRLEYVFVLKTEGAQK
jgi:rod shape-determining protein MreC